MDLNKKRITLNKIADLIMKSEISTGNALSVIEILNREKRIAEMNEEIDEFMRKILKNYEIWKQTHDEAVAHDIEVQFAFLRVLLGERFDDLRAFTRAENEVSSYLDGIEKKKQKKEAR